MKNTSDVIVRAITLVSAGSLAYTAMKIIRYNLPVRLSLVEKGSLALNSVLLSYGSYSIASNVVEGIVDYSTSEIHKLQDKMDEERV